MIRLLPALMLAACLPKSWGGVQPAINEGTCFVATGVSLVGDFYAGLTARPPRLPEANHNFRLCGDVPIPELPCEARIWVDAIVAYAPGVGVSVAYDPLNLQWPAVDLGTCP